MNDLDASNSKSLTIQNVDLSNIKTFAGGNTTILKNTIVNDQTNFDFSKTAILALNNCALPLKNESLPQKNYKLVIQKSKHQIIY